MSNELLPSPVGERERIEAEWRALHGVKKLPQCPCCGTTPPEIVSGERGQECADCGSQSVDLFLWSDGKEPR